MFVREERTSTARPPSKGEKQTNERRGRRGETIGIRFPYFKDSDGDVRVGIDNDHAMAFAGQQKQ